MDLYFSFFTYFLIKKTCILVYFFWHSHRLIHNLSTKSVSRFPDALFHDNKKGLASTSP